MATAEQMRAWLDRNADQAGTPNFVRVTDELNKVTAGSSAGTPSVAATDSMFPGGIDRKGAQTVVGRIGAGLGAGVPDAPPSDLPTLQEKLAVDRGGESPYSFSNTLDRYMTTGLAKIPDMGITLYNAAARLTGHPESQTDYLTPQMREAAGTKELPIDAPAWRRYGEAGAAGVIGGGGRAAILPTAGALTAQAGAQKAGLGETGQLAAGLFGGMLPRLSANAARYAVNQRYQNMGDPKAQQIVDAAREVGVTGTDRALPSATAGANTRDPIQPYPQAGSLARYLQSEPTPRQQYPSIDPSMPGNREIQRYQTTLEARPGPGPDLTNMHDLARQQMIDAVSRVIQNRTGVAEPTGNEALIGGKAISAARAADAAVKNRVGPAYDRLVTDIGRSPAPVSSILDAIAAQTPKEAMSGQRSLAFRQSELEPLITRPYQPGNPTVPGEQLFKYRTDLGKSFEQGKYSAAKELYSPTTDALKQASQSVGVPSSRFDAVNQNYRAYADEGGLRERLAAIMNKTPGQAHDYLAAGEQDPSRLTAFRQDITQGLGPQSGGNQVAGIYGSHLQNVLENTLLRQGGNAPGPISYSNRIRAMDPTSIKELAGSLPSAQQLQDISTAARAWHRPTMPGGGQRAMSDVVSGAISKLAGATLGATAGHLIGGPPGAATGANVGPSLVKTALGYLGPRWVDDARAAILQSPSAQAGMLNRPTPFKPLIANQGMGGAAAALLGSRSY